MKGNAERGSPSASAGRRVLRACGPGLEARRTRAGRASGDSGTDGEVRLGRNLKQSLRT